MSEAPALPPANSNICLVEITPLLFGWLCRILSPPQELEQKAERCVVQLSNAEKLIGGLGGEEMRWKDTVATLTLARDKLPGESSGFSEMDSEKTRRQRS